jgi:hypothetical protein
MARALAHPRDILSSPRLFFFLFSSFLLFSSLPYFLFVCFCFKTWVQCSLIARMYLFGYIASSFLRFPSILSFFSCRWSNTCDALLTAALHPGSAFIQTDADMLSLVNHIQRCKLRAHAHARLKSAWLLSNQGRLCHSKSTKTDKTCRRLLVCCQCSTEWRAAGQLCQWHPACACAAAERCPSQDIHSPPSPLAPHFK